MKKRVLAVLLVICSMINLLSTTVVKADSSYIETGDEFGRTQYLAEKYVITNPRLVYDNKQTYFYADIENLTDSYIDMTKINIYFYNSKGEHFYTLDGIISRLYPGETLTPAINAGITEDWRYADICSFQIEIEDTGEVSTIRENVVIENETMYFAEHQYQYFEGGISWYDAKKKCEELGGYLVVVSSEEEQKAINEYVSELTQLGKLTKQNIWLGTTISNGVLSWIVDEGSTYTNWASGEPNNVFNMQDCVMMYTSLSVNGSLGYWNDENGNGRNWEGFALSDTGYICEWSEKTDNNGDNGEDGKEENGGDNEDDNIGNEDNSENVEGDTGNVENTEYVLFEGHKYQYFNDGISWKNAQAKCEELGGHLLVISSKEEQEFINSYVTELYEADKMSKWNIWLGATIKSSGLNWIIDEGGTYTNWNKGEPNNMHSIEDCVMMYTQLAYDAELGYWNDENGNGRSDDSRYTLDKFGYICEWDEELSDEDVNERAIGVFTTEKSLCVETNDSLWLAFGIIENDKFDGEWEKFAIAVSDPTVVELSDYQETEYGYSIEVIGKKQGATNIVITDTLSGISEVIRITVCDKYVQTQSFDLNNMPVFYPNTTKWESEIKTNIYNLNGLYVNNYSAIKDSNSNKYTVSFDVYNSKYYYGAVDIYDENGNWNDYEEIKGFSDITSIWKTGEQAFYLITDVVEHKMLTYEQKSFSEYTHISFELPENGYFVISNNLATSPGTYFANSFAILFDAATAALDLAISDSLETSAFEGFMDGNKQNLTERMVNVLVDNAEESEEIQKVFLGTLESSIRDVTKDVAKAELKFVVSESNDMISSMVTLAEDILNSFEIDWKKQYGNVVGIGESIFTKLSGPAGIVLSGCFSINEASNKLLMAVEMATSTDSTYVIVHSNVEDGYINQNGVVINTSGNIDSDAVLQVFRVSNDDSVDDIFIENNSNAGYELYNICFVKNDQLVQPNGQVTVYIPIPTWMSEKTCKICRQEDDGTWTTLDARVEGKYLVFETNHFSLYAIVGENKTIKIESLPNTLVYNNGDILNDEGLVINVDGKLITEGFVTSPTVLSQCGTQKIIVKYGSLSTEFEVTVMIDSEESAAPELPNDPEKPTAPELPNDPEEPVAPELPNDPEEPVAPELPNDPEKPTEPEVPNGPEKPTEPEVPSDPEKPNQPNIPSEPDAPEIPNDPEKPSDSNVSEDVILPDDKTDEQVIEWNIEKVTEDIMVINISDALVLTDVEIKDLCEKNKVHRLLLKVNNNISITFEKGTMNAVEGMSQYDFTITIVPDYTKAEIPSTIQQINFISKVVFNYSGQLPAEALIRIPVGTQHVGKTLYYTLLKDDGTFGTAQSVVVDSEGYIIVKQAHCSNYVITTKNPNAKVIAPDTGDVYVCVWLTISIIVLAILPAKYLKQKNMKR